MCRESASTHAGGPAAGGAVQGRHGAHRRAGRPQGSRATADAAGLCHPQRQGALPHCLLSICPAKAELPLQHAFTFALTAHCAAERQLLNHVTALLPVVVDLAATLSIPWESALRSGPDAMGWLAFQVLQQCQRWCPNPERLFTSIGPKIHQPAPAAPSESSAPGGAPAGHFRGWDDLKFAGGDVLNPGAQCFALGLMLTLTWSADVVCTLLKWQAWSRCTSLSNDHAYQQGFESKESWGEGALCRHLQTRM